LVNLEFGERGAWHL